MGREISSTRPSFPYDGDGALGKRRAGVGAVPASAPAPSTADSHRARLLAGAAVALAAGRGRITIEDVITSAGVSRSIFYDHFDSARECIQVAHWEAFERLVETIRRAGAGAGEWPQRLAAGVRAAIRFAVESPDEANLLLFPGVSVDAERAASVFASDEQLVGMLRAGREHSAQAAEMPELVERIMVGGATSMIAGRLMRDSADCLLALESELVHLMLIPYVGHTEARRIATFTG